MSSTISRRTTLKFAAAFAGAASGITGFAVAAGAAISDVRVDVGPLRASGAAEAADWVADALPAALKKSFASHWSASGGGTVVAQISRLSLGTFQGSGGGGRRGGGAAHASSQDSIEGDVSLVDAGGATTAHAHLLATRSVPGPSTDTHSRQLRVNALCAAFAHWTPRKLGL